MNVRPGDESPTQDQLEKFLEEWNMDKSWGLSFYKGQEERNSSQLYSERGKTRDTKDSPTLFIGSRFWGPCTHPTHE